MIKKISLYALLLSCSLMMCACEKEIPEDEKEQLYLTGYIVDINDESIEVVSTQGDYKFDITNAKLETNDKIEIDDTCEIYFSEDLKDDELNIATKVVEYFNGYLIGTISNIEGNKFTITSDGQSYTFENFDNEVDLSSLDLNELYDVEFDKKLSSQEINIANKIKLLEVDNAPSEEVEILETFNGILQD